MNNKYDKQIVNVAIANAIIDILSLVSGLLLFIVSLFNERYSIEIIFVEWILMCAILSVTSVLFMTVYAILSSIIDQIPDESKASECTDIFELLYMPKIKETGFDKTKFNLSYIFTHLPKPLYFVVVIYQCIPYLTDIPFFIPISILVEIILISMFVIERMMIRKAIKYLLKDSSVKTVNDSIIVPVISEDSKSKLPEEGFKTKELEYDNGEESSNEL